MSHLRSDIELNTVRLWHRNWFLREQTDYWQYFQLFTYFLLKITLDILPSYQTGFKSRVHIELDPKIFHGKFVTLVAIEKYHPEKYSPDQHF